MTSGEIKEMYSMRDILIRYGLQPNQKGFIHCPFHRGDRDASMKIYDRDFHCFACGAHGDIFSFIMLMECCDFKDAFHLLGGEYEKKPTFHSKLVRYRSDQRKKMRDKQKRKEKDRRSLNNLLIDIYRDSWKRSEPFSDTWTDCYNKLQYQLYLHDEYDKEANEALNEKIK